MSTRIYAVKGPLANVTRLVRASSRAQAVRHVAKTWCDAAVASQDDLVDLLKAGVEIESASEEDKEQQA